MKYSVVVFIVSLMMPFSAVSNSLVTDSGTVVPFYSGIVSAIGFEPICARGSLDQTAQVKFIAIESENGIRIKYKGLDMIFVEVGAQVDVRTSIGHIVSTEKVKPTLHLEAQHIDGTVIWVPSFCSPR